MAIAAASGLPRLLAYMPFADAAIVEGDAVRMVAGINQCDTEDQIHVAKAAGSAARNCADRLTLNVIGPESLAQISMLRGSVINPQ